MSKKELSESDIRAKYIDPALKNSGWDEMTQIRREVSYTKGRITVRGKLVSRGKPKKADYVLYHGEVPLAVIEAKDNKHAMGAGMQQALGYAEDLKIPFVFSSNLEIQIKAKDTYSVQLLESSIHNALDEAA